MPLLNDNFRDHISTIDQKGKRVWIYPKKPVGSYFNKRKILAYFLLLALFGMPYLTINGEPSLLFNVLEQKFVIFGQIFHPQDLHIFALAMITMVVFVTLFTIIFGRLFCGWVCPQTIFMELVFRRIEYWIEGDWTHQKKLNADPWNGEKIFKKTLKHSLFWLVSFLIANTFLSYIIGYEKLWEIILDHPSAHIGGLISLSIFTTVFYAVFAFMREQICTTICPYGRLQGVLLDRNSLVVAYDYVRGENRSKFKKGENRSELGKGDCIDCLQCIHVCPTGIDIRNGTQLECVNCTACIDACDTMMAGVGLEKGLIRYASEDGIKNKVAFQWTTRVKVYVTVLFILLGLLTVMIVGRNPVETTIIKTRGTTFQKYEEIYFSNLFDIYSVNKTQEDINLELKVLEGPGEIRLIGNGFVVKKHSELKGKFMLIVKKEIVESEVLDHNSASIDFVIGVYNNNDLIETLTTTFEGPNI